MTRDLAQAYLNGLQVGYRIEEYRYTTTGTPTFPVIIPGNANRTMLYIRSSSVVTVCEWHLPSGMRMSVPVDPTLTYCLLTMSKHYQLPTWEVRVNNANSPIQIVAFGIIKG